MAEREAELFRKLNTPVSVEFKDVPINSALLQIAHQAGVAARVNGVDLADEGIPFDEPVAFACKDLPAREAMRLLGRDCGLTWTVRNSEVIVTTRTVANEVLSTRVYDISPLAPPLSPRTVNSVSSAARPDFGIGYSDTSRDFDSAIQLIQNQTSGPWLDVDGEGGTIDQFVSGDRALLVIRQTVHLHEEIAALLRTLEQSATSK